MTTDLATILRRLWRVSSVLYFYSIKKIEWDFWDYKCRESPRSQLIRIAANYSNGADNRKNFIGKNFLYFTWRTWPRHFEALFLFHAVRIFSRFESRESRKTEFNSSIRRQREEGIGRRIEPDRPPFFLSLSLARPPSSSLFGMARGKRIIQLVPSIEIGLSSIPLHSTPPIQHPHSVYRFSTLCIQATYSIPAS